MDSSNNLIPNLVKECYESLSKLLKITQDEACPVRDSLGDCDIEHMLERFKQWSGNLGALQPPDSLLSLEHRLRDSPVVRGAILKILCNLQDSIVSAIEITSGTRQNRMADPVLEQNIDLADYDISSSDSDSQSSGVQELQNRPDLASTSEIIELLISIKLSIRNLFRASIFVRKFAPKHRRQRASRTEPFDNRADVVYVKDKYPSLTETLALRLGEANARRRQYFAYRRGHNEHLSEFNLKPNATETQRVDLLAPASRPLDFGVPAGSGRTRYSLGTTEATAFVNNEAQNQLNAILEDTQVMSLVSYATSVIDPSITNMEFPPLPKETEDIFVCQYCFEVVKLNPINKERQWRKHVLEDLEPYICTFPGCALETYKSQHAWFEHELLLHRNVWLCPGCSYQCNTTDLLERHIGTCYGNQIRKKQVSSIVEASRRPANYINPKDCPFCPEDWATREDEGNNVDRNVTIAVNIDQFRRHLGQHLEQIALFSLPRSHIDLEAESKEVGGIVDRVSLPIGPRWIREDCGKGWNILSGKRSVFVAFAAFRMYFEKVKKRATIEPELALPRALAEADDREHYGIDPSQYSDSQRFDADEPSNPVARERAVISSDWRGNMDENTLDERASVSEAEEQEEEVTEVIEIVENGVYNAKILAEYSKFISRLLPSLNTLEEWKGAMINTQLNEEERVNSREQSDSKKNDYSQLLEYGNVEQGGDEVKNDQENQHQIYISRFQKLVLAPLGTPEPVDRRIRLAIIDNEADMTSPIFGHMIAKSISTESNPEINEFSSWSAAPVSHGTTVASLIGLTNNYCRLYMASVAEPQNKIRLPDVVRAINWAVEQKVDIISLSIYFQENDSALEEAVRRASEERILIFCSKPNGVWSEAFPVGYNDYVFNVGGTSDNNQNAPVDIRIPDNSYQLQGKRSFDNSNPSTLASISSSWGTSVAAGVASLALLLLKTFNPSMDGDSDDSINGRGFFYTKEGMMRVFARMGAPKTPIQLSKLFPSHSADRSEIPEALARNWNMDNFSKQ
ncbi:hypothetical protein GGR51DRAFT_515003 [Nemania sp. FL0031]|nr:hypothetical protein GGR51DRAFT_515003 [Nemania sp. FL0031]